MINKLNIIIFLVFPLILGLFSCESNISGELNKNKLPETYALTDTIIRIGNNRYTTQISIQWWGDDPDGFIKGYEFSFDKINWQYTKQQDSSFLVSIPTGQDTLDFAFYVRAIDNTGAKDLTPARIVYPVKNSPPLVIFEYDIMKRPEKSFPVLKYSWSATDPDGDNNIDYFELYLNDTLSSPLIVDEFFSSVIIKATDLSGSMVDCDVFQGNSLVLNSNKLTGLKLNDTNCLLIRAVDRVGEKSELKTSYKIFVRKPSSQLLLINAYNSSIQTREDFYKSNLQSVGVNSFDIIRINEVKTDHFTELSPDNITQSMIFNLFKTIIWFGKEIDYSMSMAQKTTEDFFINGGKMFLAVDISSSIDEQAGYLDFSPIDSLVNMPKNVNSFRIEKDSLVIPAYTGWPILKSAKISNSRPFYEKTGCFSLYDARIVKTGGFGKALWEGKSTIMAKRNNAFGKTNFIICSLELHNLDGNNNMIALFTKLFIDELEL